MTMSFMSKPVRPVSQTSRISMNNQTNQTRRSSTANQTNRSSTTNQTNRSRTTNQTNQTNRSRTTNQTRKNQPEKGRSIFDVNSVVVLNVLREVQWNWFSFVVLLEPKFKSHGYTQEVFDQFLVDFANQLPNLGLSDVEFNLTEQSRAAYLSEVMQKETRMEEIVAETASDDDDDDNGSALPGIISEDELDRKLKGIKYKAKRLAKAEIESEGLHGRRKPFERSNTALSRHPDIGEVMEDMVKEADVGADKWRRTGVYTFTGDEKREDDI